MADGASLRQVRRSGDVVTLAGEVTTVGRVDDEPFAVAEAPNGDIDVYVTIGVMRAR